MGTREAGDFGTSAAGALDCLSQRERGSASRSNGKCACAFHLLLSRAGANLTCSCSQSRYAFSVAQICNLLVRRIAFCGALTTSRTLESPDVLPITNRRYSRLQICATRLSGALTTYESRA